MGMNICIVCRCRHEGEGSVCHDCEDKHVCGTCAKYKAGKCTVPLPFFAEQSLYRTVDAWDGEECELWG